MRLRDPDAAAVLAAPAAVDLLGAVAENARSLDVRDFSARYVDQVDATGSEDVWSGVAELAWRFGPQGALSRVEVSVRFTRVGQELTIGGLGGEVGRTPTWLTGPVAVVRAPGILVLARSTPAHARRVAVRAVKGLRQVGEVLSGAAGESVIEVPAGAADLDAVLAAQAGTHEQIAAVTTSVDGEHGPVHVFLNPDVFWRLEPHGAQVVMTHELVHLLTGDATREMVPWLSEGFADYVALRDSELPLVVALGRALREVRRDGVPTHLPGEADFHAASADLQGAYEQAWLACRLIAERLGEEALVTLHREVGEGAEISAVLARLGWSEQGLLAHWQDRLETLIP